MEMNDNNARRKKIVVFGCLGASVFVILCALCAGCSIWYLFILDLPNLDADLTLPPQIEIDETFDLIVTMNNPHNHNIILDSIDIDHSLLEGLQVLEIEPVPVGTDDYSFLNLRSWQFGKPVAPGEQVVVTFKMRAIYPGHYSGNVEICNPSQDCKTLFADVVVDQ